MGFKLIVVALTLLVATVAMAAVQRRDFLLGGNFYFVDTTAARTRAQALAFCSAQDAELAKVTNKKIYTMLTRSLAVGNYWIDGMDKTDASRFSLNDTCTQGTLDFTDIPKENVDIPAASCLNLYKGPNSTAHKIQAVNCGTSLRGVVCSIPEDGCPTPTTTTTPAPGGP